MHLSQLLAALPAASLRVEPRDADPVIRGIAIDSRQVAPGDLFVALRGAHADGHDHLEQAAELGAVAFLLEHEPIRGDTSPRLPLAVVSDSRRALAPISARFFGHPARELTLVGVTGTNGKTSTVYLVESMLKAAGVPTGVIGTVEVRYAGERHRAINTTPESLELQRSLRAMRTHGVKSAVMEVSSHGLALGRVEGCAFDVAAVTNVTQDHLDFHGSMESYRDAKLALFGPCLKEGKAVAVVNADDASAEAFEAAARRRGARVLRVSRHRERQAELAVLEAEVGLEGSRVRLRLPSGRELGLELPLLGDFNVENLAVAAACAAALGLGPQAIARGAASCPQVPGRVQRVATSNPRAPTVLVDYAHTPDAVEKLLRTLRPMSAGRLITVFGCGGDRDRSKRPLMAEAVARYSDLAIATSDNPRTEDPEAILRDVEAGLGALQAVDPLELGAQPGCYTRIVDRRRAIERAIGCARHGDLVLLVGKGHEDYQIVGHEHLPFDDREEAARALAGVSA